MDAKLSILRVLIDKLEETREKLGEIEEEIIPYIQDKSLPLNERWDCFINNDLGGHDCYIQRFNGSKIGIDFIEDGWKEKYMTLYVSDILEHDEKGNNITEKYTQEEIDEFRENVLQKYIKSFELNW